MSPGARQGNPDVALSVLDVLDTDPPLVNRRQSSYDGFTHSPEGRRIKPFLTYRRGG